jgi:hypothetical protein
MRALLLLSLTAMAACASAGSTSSTPPPRAQETVRVTGGAGGATLTMSGADASSVQTLPYSVAQVWQVLPAVLDSLGIPVRTLDPATHRAGNAGFAIRRKLKNTPLSRYLDCGTSAMGPTADDYDVNLSVFAELHPAASGASTLTTTVEAAARPPNYAQEYGRCSSKGLLEARINEMIKARLGR